MEMENFSARDVILHICEYEFPKYVGVFRDGKIYPVIGMALVDAHQIGRMIAGIGINTHGFFLFEQQSDFLGYADINDKEEQQQMLITAARRTL
ncbi:MAG: hypothetical protein ONB13_05445 [candidate division KSB1 bacterium]|nr:hypothetical protein [candidate division KSB1 bacterium]